MRVMLQILDVPHLHLSPLQCPGWRVHFSSRHMLQMLPCPSTSAVLRLHFVSEIMLQRLLGPKGLVSPGSLTSRSRATAPVCTLACTAIKQHKGLLQLHASHQASCLAGVRRVRRSLNCCSRYILPACSRLGLQYMQPCPTALANQYRLHHLAAFTAQSAESPSSSGRLGALDVIGL